MKALDLYQLSKFLCKSFLYVIFGIGSSNHVTNWVYWRLSWCSELFLMYSLRLQFLPLMLSSADSWRLLVRCYNDTDERHLGLAELSLIIGMVFNVHATGYWLEVRMAMVPTQQLLAFLIDHLLYLLCGFRGKLHIPLHFLDLFEVLIVLCRFARVWFSDYHSLTTPSLHVESVACYESDDLIC